jgi:hypothetical protein
VGPVQAGGQPYCVQTCPSKAIRYGERDQMLADAQARVQALKARYPHAQVYGQSQLGGLGLVMVLLEQPSVYGLPEDPAVATPVRLWQNVVQPFSMPLAALGVAVLGFAFVAARREHGREMAGVDSAGHLATGAPVVSADAVADAAPAAASDATQEAAAEANTANGASTNTDAGADGNTDAATPSQAGAPEDK